jgi:hypothetical protein
MNYNVGGQSPVVGPVQGPATPDTAPGVPTKPTVGQEARADDVAGNKGIKPQGHTPTVSASHVPPSGGAETPPGATAAAAAKKMSPVKELTNKIHTMSEEASKMLRGLGDYPTEKSLRDGIDKLTTLETTLKGGLERYGSAKGAPAKISGETISDWSGRSEQVGVHIYSLNRKLEGVIEMKTAMETDKMMRSTDIDDERSDVTAQELQDALSNIKKAEERVAVLSETKPLTGDAKKLLDLTSVILQTRKVEITNKLKELER